MFLTDRELCDKRVVRRGPIWSIDGRHYIKLQREYGAWAWKVWPLGVWTLLTYPFWLARHKMARWFWECMVPLEVWGITCRPGAQRVKVRNLWRYLWFMPEGRREKTKLENAIRLSDDTIYGCPPILAKDEAEARVKAALWLNKSMGLEADTLDNWHFIVGRIGDVPAKREQKE